MYESVDPTQGYDPAKFERPHLNGFWEKANIKSSCQIRKHIDYLHWVQAKVKKKKFE